MSKLLIISVWLFVGAFAAPPSLKYDSKIDWRVVGGKNAVTGQFPFIISLRYDGSHSCGGSILNSEWILTAAHCLYGTPASALTVVAGSALLDTGGETHKVSKVIYHERYDPFETRNDVGLVKLASPINLNGDTIKSINRETNDVGAGYDVTLIGWGTTSYPGSIPNNLQYIGLKTVTLDECNNRHGAGSVDDRQVCTLTKSGEGACHGDSGGPLVGADGNLIGIVSWGMPCAVGYPDVFTRVAAFNDWIDNKIRSN